MKREGRELESRVGDRRQLANAKSGWRKMTKDQRREFVAWVLDQESGIPQRQMGNVLLRSDILDHLAGPAWTARPSMRAGEERDLLAQRRDAREETQRKQGAHVAKKLDDTEPSPEPEPPDSARPLDHVYGPCTRG